MLNNVSCVYDHVWIVCCCTGFSHCISSVIGKVCHLSLSVCVQVLLSQDELLQLSGVQCIAEVLTSHPDYGRTLLSADIAGTCILVPLNFIVSHSQLPESVY